ncbi:ABC transporter permease [Clostridiaceae bacterium M8S5]|nr:ABC transporter permease [Clostridiaceae bacterium M8S5]
MLNYIKSEAYRNLRTKGNYIFLLSCLSFVTFINIALGLYASTQYNFPYGNTRFSFSNLYAGMGMPMMLCVTIVAIVLGQEFKHHTLKNSISYGITRKQIYFSKFLMELAVSAINLILICSAFIISAYAMLNDSGAIYFNILIRSIIACIPLFIFSVTVAHSLYFIFDNDIVAVSVWGVIVVVVPKLLSLAGMGIKVFREIANWMPWNMLTATFYGRTKEWGMTWSTNKGMIKCFVVGIVGSIIFYIIGQRIFEKREIK